MEDKMTVKEMVAEITACDCEYVTYGDGDLGKPIAKADAIADISSMEDDMIGEGTWYPCDEDGKILE
jgi:hypothetical protein